MIPKVYVYATDSHSEITIGDFLLKVRSDIQWIVRSPNRPKPPKNAYVDEASFPMLTGRTGDDLEQFMLEEINAHPYILTECAAVLLEDDLDFRDAGENQAGFLQAQQARLDNKIICMYAAPEIETWFVEDWENSFGNVRIFSNQQIATRLRSAVNRMKEECGGNLENYAQYHSDKFSDWIIEKIEQIALDYDIIAPISYSKRLHGSKFLAEIDPEKVVQNCRVYFAKAYHKIKELHTNERSNTHGF